MSNRNIEEFLREQRKRPLKVKMAIHKLFDYKCPKCGWLMNSSRNEKEPLLIYRCPRCSYSKIENLNSNK
ncbi:hypothetical protein [Clostridium sporogenes]|uniref:Uncharacterized protein n=2 Tax=Clostridium TaxID=1485 RepID=A0A6M0T2I8_CLOBO|nr:hypothetical protein [Clostridium sporogenes]NFA60381.1 hypothetical protein [Clostridium botulinum]APF25139.1 hypothetical protein NPD7_3992 [Clostridium sporogenes]APH15425.1 hypothetical protein NPD5_3770 [Clostridium sporogenes]NFE18510.1 hypothetical protein [Clostridium botulinum]NFI74455.1 hypothetical protein [Clostridium sporogenes]